MSNDTQTLTLTDFLLARIAEDEAEALAIQADPRHTRDTAGPERHEEYEGQLTIGVERVLAECEAKRRIIRLHGDPAHPCPMRQGNGFLVHTGGPGPCDVMRDLATVYAEHPDCREDWKL